MTYYKSVTDSWASLGLQGDPTSPFWRRSALGFLWREWCWSWNSSTLATSWEELTHWKRLWCWKGLGAGWKGDDRGWDGWMASLTRWTWVWVNSGSWWWTGRPDVLRFMGSQRVGHDWATEQTELIIITMLWFSIKIGKYINAMDWYCTQNKPTIYINDSRCHLVFGKGVKQHNEERNISQQMVPKQLDKININPYSSPYTKINLRWITDINIKAKMIKIPRENRGEHLCYFRVGKGFLGQKIQ